MMAKGKSRQRADRAVMVQTGRKCDVKNGRHSGGSAGKGSGHIITAGGMIKNRNNSKTLQK